MRKNLYRPYLGQIVKFPKGEFLVVAVGNPPNSLPGSRNFALATLEPYHRPIDPHGTEYGHKELL